MSDTNSTKTALVEYIKANGPVKHNEPPMELRAEYGIDVWSEMHELVESSQEVRQNRDGLYEYQDPDEQGLSDLQLKKDLGDFATHGVELSDYPSRSEVVKKLLNSPKMEVHSVGDYQGTLGFVIKTGGYIWVIKEHYGSCALCDGFISAKREGNAVEYGRSILRNAYCFDDVSDAQAFVALMAEQDAYGWGCIEDGLLEILADW